MVNYGWKCEGWSAEEKQTFAGALRVKFDFPFRHEAGWDDGKKPYLEIDGNYEGVRIRRLTFLSQEEQDRIIKEANLLYEASLKIIQQERIKKMNEDEKLNLLNQNLAARNVETITPKDKITRMVSEKAHTKRVVLEMPSENDRLVNFQLTKSLLHQGAEGLGADDFVRNELALILKAFWKTAYLPALDKAKVWHLEQENVPVIMHTESTFEKNLPFKNIFINTDIPIGKRLHRGIFVGSFYTEDYHYRLIISIYTQEFMYQGKMREMAAFEMFPVEDYALEAYNITELSPVQKKLRNFVFSFLNYINEPDVEEVHIPLNPKNNERRIARGRMPLPEFSTIVVRGKLRVYLDRLSDRISQITGRHQKPHWVRGYYMHFRNKVRFRKLYAMEKTDLFILGYSIDEGLIRRWRMPRVRGRGAGKVGHQEWRVE